MQKNDQIELTIVDMGVNGEGIGKFAGMPFFVKDALIGDVIRARVTKLKKTYGYARIEEILTPSKDRVAPRCPQYRRCGGCQLQALSYEKQLSYKQQKVANDLVRIGGFAEEEIAAKTEQIIGMDEPYRYRNKAQFPVGEDKDGHIVTGFYATHTHSLIPEDDCQLGIAENRDILIAVKKYMTENRIPPYDETTGNGLVRHILIRCGFATKELMVCLIINGTALPAKDDLIRRLSAIPHMTSISYNCNTKRTNVILGGETKTVWGQPYITDRLRSIEFRISPQSFYQVNPVQTEKLYGTALEYAGLTGKETVWDLYCGIGTISLFLAQKAGKVYGVEVVPQAIADARVNAEINGFRNVEFFVGKAEEVLPEFYAGAQEGRTGGTTDRADSEVRTDSGVPEGRTDSTTGRADGEVGRTGDAVPGAPEGDMRHPDVIVVDPPRKGCDPACLTTILAMQPKRIVYVSCDPATLARDLRILCDGGYELARVRAVDQFCHTVHTEVVALLTRCVEIEKTKKET